MYIKFNDRNEGRRFTYFSAERIINGEKVTHTTKSVFATLSDGIKTGENNGQAIWENDYWNTVFCGKAYEKALKLENKDRVMVVEMNIRNVYSAITKKNYPQITVTDFDVISENANNGEEFMSISKEECPLPID